MNKLSKVSFFLFVTMYNYLWFRILLFNYFYNEFGSMGVFYTGILAILVLVFFGAMPEKLMTKAYEERYKKSWFKYFYAIILILEGVFCVSFCAYLISDIFIHGANYWMILLGIAFVITTLSRLLPKDVMEISTLFNIVGYVILFFCFIYLPALDFTNLYPTTKMDGIALLLLSFMMIGDNLTLLIHKKDVGFQKMNFILAILMAIFFLGFEYVLLICSSGTEFFKGLDYVGFIFFSIEPVSKYIGNFDFSYIFYILISCIFKYSYNLSLIRTETTLSGKFVNVAVFILLFVLGLVNYYFIPIDETMIRICYILTSFSFLILFWFIKECYFVRRIKE